jgi:NADH:ubiquinone oxidoreductase subunit 5 (subunit L)/multisubunit Na+/H+ antiporter MnhA subunit
VLAVAVAITADNAFLFFMAWESLTVCIYLIATPTATAPTTSFRATSPPA